MGHREDLLAGAKRCLYEKGYARTTARDIVAASGTNLASIGYHYGSTEALLNAAMIDAIEEWGEEIGRALAVDADPGASPLERFEATWARVIGSFAAHRQLWVATLEATTQAEHAPEVRAFLADAVQQGRLGLAELFQDLEEWGEEIGRALAVDADPGASPLERFEATWARVIGSFAAHRQLWVATLEATTQAEHAPEVRAFLADAVQQGRLGLAELFQDL